MSLPKTCGAVTRGVLLGALVAATVIVLLLGSDDPSVTFRYVGF